MKLFFWSAIIIFFVLLFSKCERSSTVPAPVKERVPSSSKGFPHPVRPDASHPTVFPEFQNETPIPLNYIPPRDPDRTLPGQVFPPAKGTDPTTPLLPSASYNGQNSSPLPQGMHMEGVVPVVRRRR